MVPLVLFEIELTDYRDLISDETTFREYIGPGLTRLQELKGSFDRITDIGIHIYRSVQDDGHEHWSAKIGLSISVGMARAVHLCEVYRAYAALLQYELSALEVKARCEILKFS